MRARITLAALALVAAGALARAEDKPVDRADLDKRIVGAVYESASLGTDIFNKGNHEGCYRLYEGTLLALVPMLDHRSVLQGKVKLRLDRAAKMGKAADAAFELRTALDDIQNEIAPPKDKKGTDKGVGSSDNGKKTVLWDRLGGEKGVKAVVHDIVLMAAEDPKVNFLRGGKIKIDAKGIDHLELMLVQFISQNTGGPLRYDGKSMKEVHKGMMITDAEFDAMVADAVAVLKKHKVAQADIDELGKVVEGTRKDIVEVKK
jgi:hemoglobin